MGGMHEIPLLFGLPFLASAFASSFYERPFPDTVRDTSTIVRGKIGKSETQWTTLPDGSKHLFTYYEVDVSEGFKGGPSAGAPIRIRELGGTKDGVSLNVSGTAGFEKGEDVVVMLGDANAQVDGAYPVSGMMMGKFNLEKGADGKEYLRGPGIGSTVQPGLRNEHSGAQAASVSLDRLREIVRSQASEPRASPSPLSSVTSNNGLLFGKSSAVPETKTEIHDADLGANPAKSERSSRFFPVLVLGLAFGIAWFLKSRKKRR